MVRQRPRKGIEELYGTKFDSKAQAASTSANKSGRIEREFGGYHIQSNTPFSTVTNGPSTAQPVQTVILPSSRRKATASRTGHAKSEKYNIKDAMCEEAKREHTIKGKSYMTSRPEKSPPITNVMQESKHCVYPIVHNPKMEISMKEMRVNPRHHHHRTGHHHMEAAVIEDKDDDADEFFDLIKHTVENAIGKTISDVLNRNFREISSKIERFSNELKATNTLLNKLQSEVGNKVVHYGEENSRHFRYLCMKSEYDKMFYQQNNQLYEGASGDMKGQGTSRRNVEHDDSKNAIPCTCRSNMNTNIKQKPSLETLPQKTSSDDHSMGQKFSESRLHELLNHIQHLCLQVETNRHLESNRFSKGLEGIKLNKQVFEEDDDDESQISSDGMTPRSNPKFGGTTMRGSIIGNGANLGDGDN